MKTFWLSIAAVAFMVAVCVLDLLMLNTQDALALVTPPPRARSVRVIRPPEGSLIILRTATGTERLGELVPERSQGPYTFWYRMTDAVAGEIDFITYPDGSKAPTDGSARVLRLEYRDEFKYWFVWMAERSGDGWRKTSDYF